MSAKGQSMRVAWIGSQPGNLRAETLGPWGQPTLTFLLRGAAFCVYAFENNRCYKGKGTARNLSRFLSVPVRAEDLFSLLSGRPPVYPFNDAKIEVTKGNGQWCLCLYKRWNRLIEKMWFKDDRKTVERVELFDGSGNLKYEIKFNQFKNVGSILFPHEMIIYEAQGGPVLSLNVERFWTNVTIPSKAFILEPCDGEVVPLDS